MSSARWLRKRTAGSLRSRRFRNAALQHFARQFFRFVCESGGGLFERGVEGSIGVKDRQALVCAGAGGAADGDAGDFGGAGHSADGADYFAHERLAVDAAFAGEDEVGVGDCTSQANCLGDYIYSRDKHYVGEGEEGKRDASGGAGAGFIAEWPTAGAFEEIRPAGEAIIEDFDGLGVCAFLGAEDEGGAFWAAGGIEDVAGEGETNRLKSGRRRLPSDSGNVLQLPAADGFVHCATVFVVEYEAEGLHHARAAIDGGAASDRQNHVFDLGINYGSQNFAETERRGYERVSGFRRDECIAAYSCEFDDGGRGLVDEADDDIDWSAERIMRGDSATLSRGGFDQAIKRAFATISHRNYQDFGVWSGAADAICEMGGDGSGVEDRLKAIRGDDDSHGRRKCRLEARNERVSR